MSHLSNDELAAAQLLPMGAPYIFAGVSNGFMSLSRHSIGMKYNGQEYAYIPATDECIRLDVLALAHSMRKAEKAAAEEAESARGVQLSMPF